MDTAFRLRYRVQQVDGTRRALVLEDPDGTFYLFSGGRLQVRIGSFSTWLRVSRSLSRARYAWQVVEGGDLHSLEALPLLEAQADGAKDGAGVQTCRVCPPRPAQRAYPERFDPRHPPRW